MAIDTYSGLKTSIATWLWRAGETETEAYIPDMIIMAEAHFNRVLNARQMEAVDGALSVVDGVASLPAGFRKVLSLRETAYDHVRILPKPIDELERFEDISTGRLQFYAIVGSELHFWPRVSATVRLRYKTALAPLSDANTSNWLLAAHPDAYLYQSLANGEAFNMNDQRVAMWKAKAQMVLQEIERERVLENMDALAPAPGVGVAI